MLKLEPARRRKTPLGIVPTGANAVAEARAPAIIKVRSMNADRSLSRLQSESYISAVDSLQTPAGRGLAGSTGLFTALMRPDCTV